MIRAIWDWLEENLFSLLANMIGFAALVSAGTHAWVAGFVMLLAMIPAIRRPKKQSIAENPIQPAVSELDPLGQVKAAFHGFDSPVFLLDMKANVLHQNASAQHIFGMIEAGQHISARLRAPAIIDMIRDAIGQGSNGQVEYSVPLPAELTYLVLMIRVETTADADDFYVLIFRDVSEARRIDRMRSDFVANASHELRTPLASLRGFIETILGPARNDTAAQLRFLNIMLEQVTRMSRLVDDLMSLSRLELKARLTPDAKVDLVPLIGSVADALEPLANEVGVEVVLHLPDEPVVVQGDPDELTQVFENLIENACKYGQEGKRVDVTIEHASGKALEVHVRDYGPGIADEHVPRLTERFYRASIESSRSKKGTGLGLAIVKHILTRHRARLIIRSELGSGSTFTVRF